jgi:membrane-associated phospholipid phosphatase
VDGIHLRPGRPLLAASARPWAGALLACCAILVAGLGVLFADQARADRFDHVVDSPIITWFGGHQGLVVWLAAPGSPIPAGVLSAAIVVACLLTGRLNGAVLAAAAVPAAAGLNDGLLKPLVHRTYLGVLTYPSGHTATMFALAATITVLLVMPPRPAGAGAVRVLIPAAACVLGGVVAIAVIGLRWHYFTDTVAGAAVGIGTVCGLALILDLPAARRWLARASRMVEALGAEDLTRITVCGLHFGGAIAEGEPTGNELAGTQIGQWLSTRHELAPPRLTDRTDNWP